MNNLNNILSELLKPILLVIVFVRDIIAYALNLFYLSWKSACSSMNKDILIPSFIATSAIFTLYNIFNLINLDSINTDLEMSIYNIIIIISISIVGWGFSIIASINNAKENNEDSLWKKHLKIGFKSFKFFATYSLFIVMLIFALMVISSFGLIPNVGQTILSILESPVFFLAIIIILSCISLFLGSILFGSYYCSDDYKDSLGFIDRTKNLFCMVGRKILDTLAIIIPSFIVSALFALIPFLLMIIALGDIIHKPTAGMFNEGQMYPGIALSDGTEGDKEDEYGDSFRKRSFNFLGSRDYHYRYPSSSIIEYKQELFNQVILEYNLNQREYDQAKLFANAIKSLGPLNPGRQLDSIDAFVLSNPEVLTIEGVDIEELRYSIEEELYQWSIDEWSIALKDISPEKLEELNFLGAETLDGYISELLNEILRKHYISTWEQKGFGDSWSFDSGDKLVLERLDDWVGEKYFVNKDSVFYYSSDYDFESDSYSDWKNEYSSDINGKVEYSGYSDSLFFISLTQFFLAISDALILAFPFMFVFAIMGTIIYRLYNSIFKINVFQKIIAIILILITVGSATSYLNKNKEGIVFGVIGLIINDDSE